MPEPQTKSWRLASSTALPPSEEKSKGAWASLAPSACPGPIVDPSSELSPGGGLGLVVAIALGWLVFVAGKGPNLKRFFGATGILLLPFAAGLAAHGVHELQEARLLPAFIEHMWYLNPILDENGTLGSFLRALFGYNGNPTLLEVIVYGLYLIVTERISLRSQIVLTPAQKPAATPNQI